MNEHSVALTRRTGAGDVAHACSVTGFFALTVFFSVAGSWISSVFDHHSYDQLCRTRIQELRRPV